MTTVDSALWADRCTEATLAAFEVVGCPMTGRGVFGILRRSGLSLRWAGRRDGETLAEFCAARPSGSFYLATDEHALALVEGVLTDTSAEGPNDRVLLGAFEIVCADPETYEKARARFARKAAR